VIRLDEINWILCPECGPKMKFFELPGKVTGEGLNIKCRACKSIINYTSSGGAILLEYDLSA